MHNSQPARKGHWRTAAIAVFVFLFVVSQFGNGTEPGAMDLDPSWRTLLPWALARGMQWGRDLVYTYGPLAFLHPGTGYAEETYGFFLVGQYASALALGGLAAFAASSMPTTFSAIAIAVIATWMFWMPGDVGWFCAFLFATAALFGPHAEQASATLRVVRAMWVGALLAALSLIKFTLFPLLVVFVSFGAPALLLRRRRVEALVLAFAAPLALLLAWSGAGQALGNFDDFLLNAARISAGYSQAMSLTTHREIDWLWLALFGLTLLVLAASARLARRRPDLLLVLLVLGAVTFVAWRGAITRGDAHVAMFPPIAALVLALALMLRATLDGRPRRLSPLALALPAAVLSAAAFQRAFDQPLAEVNVHTFSHNLRGLFMPSWEEAAFQNRLAGIRNQYPFARFGKALRAESMDVLTHQLGIVVAHGFRYAPRPVVQSYSAYTPELAALNAARFDQGDRPRRVLLRLDTIDGHAPTMEDPLALRRLLALYSPAGYDSGFAVLAADDAVPHQATPDTWQPAFEAAIGDWVPVPRAAGHLTIARIEIPLTLAGRVMAFLMREPRLGIEFQFADGSVRVHRMVRESARTGFIASPYVTDTEAFVQLYAGAGTEVQAVRITASEGPVRRLIGPQARIAFALSPHTARITDAELRALARQSVTEEFTHPFRVMFGMERNHREAGHAAVLIPAPARVAFEPGAGRFRATGIIGLSAGAVGNPTCIDAGADGAHVRLLRVSPGKSELVLLETRFEGSASSPRLHQSFELALELAPGERFEIDSVAGPVGSNAACDWVYMRAIRLEPLAAG